MQVNAVSCVAMFSARLPTIFKVCAVILAGCATASCSRHDGGEGAKIRLSIATGDTGGVYYPYGGGVAKVISEHLPNVEATAEVTAASVMNLRLLRDRNADLAFTTGDTLADAVEGRGVFQDGKLPIQSLASLYKNYTQIVTLASSGIHGLKDLKGKVVSTGTAGSGSEVTAFRILEAAGIDPQTGIRRQRLGVAQAVDALKDGKIDAFFWSAGLPTPAVLDLAHSPGVRIRMLSNADVLPGLHRRYNPSLYTKGVVAKETYPGLEQDVPVVSVANILAVHESMPEDLAFNITRILFERQPELASIHPEAKNLTLESAIEGSPAPFHPGAIRYYKEKNVWRE